VVVGFNRAGLWFFICYVFALSRAVIWSLGSFLGRFYQIPGFFASVIVNLMRTNVSSRPIPVILICIL
jgi:hypothetical protein